MIYDNLKFGDIVKITFNNEESYFIINKLLNKNELTDECTYDTIIGLINEELYTGGVIIYSNEEGMQCEKLSDVSDFYMKLKIATDKKLYPFKYD